MLYTPGRGYPDSKSFKGKLDRLSKNFRKGGPARVNYEEYSFILFSKAFIAFYKITKIVRAFWLVKNQWFIVAVNS